MSRVLVTGGAGFIGSHVVDALLAQGHEPVIYDTRPSPWHGRDAVKAIKGDIRDIDALTQALQGCDAVAHLAAAADVNEVQKAPVDSESLNARGTLAVLEAARRAEVSRVVYASTIWVYSDVVAEWVDEDAALEPPAHLYTATKLAGELYCRSYAELYDLEYTILRFGIPYGPRARPAAVIPAFTNKALAGEALTIAGDGSQSRRFVYVEDLAEGVARALAPVAANRIYNLVSTEDVTIKQIAEAVRHEVGEVEVVHTEGRPGDFKGVEVDGTRAESELGWRARTPFQEGVRRYVAWHREAAELAAAPAAPSRAAGALAALPLRRIAFAIAGVLALAMLIGSLSGEEMDEVMRATITGIVAAALPTLAILPPWTATARTFVARLFGAIAGVSVLAMLVPWFGEDSARSHTMLLLLIAVSAVVASTAAATGWGEPLRERLSD